MCLETRDVLKARLDADKCSCFCSKLAAKEAVIFVLFMHELRFGFCYFCFKKFAELVCSNVLRALKIVLSGLNCTRSEEICTRLSKRARETFDPTSLYFVSKQFACQELATGVQVMCTDLVLCAFLFRTL